MSNKFSIKEYGKVFSCTKCKRSSYYKFFLKGCKFCLSQKKSLNQVEKENEEVFNYIRNKLLSELWSKFVHQFTDNEPIARLLKPIVKKCTLCKISEVSTEFDLCYILCQNCFEDIPDDFKENISCKDIYLPFNDNIESDLNRSFSDLFDVPKVDDTNLEKVLRRYSFTENKN